MIASTIPTRLLFLYSIADSGLFITTKASIAAIGPQAAVQCYRGHTDLSSPQAANRGVGRRLAAIECLGGAWAHGPGKPSNIQYSC